MSTNVFLICIYYRVIGLRGYFRVLGNIIHDIFYLRRHEDLALALILDAPMFLELIQHKTKAIKNASAISPRGTTMTYHEKDSKRLQRTLHPTLGY